MASSLSSSSASVAPVRLSQQRRRGSGHQSPRRQRHRSSNRSSETDGANDRANSGAMRQHDASRRRKVLPAAILAASGALMMLASSGESNNLRHSLSRKLSATEPNNQKKLVTGGTAATRSSNGREVGESFLSRSAITAAVKKLAEPLHADEANIFAFDKNDPRPVINTFFGIREGTPLNKAQAGTLAVWKRAWSAAGWNPRVLSMHDAEAHPDYANVVDKLDDVPLGNNNHYDKACYLRHFAMAASGGGWMTDYDAVPLNMKAEVYGMDLPNDGQFTTYEGYVPSLIVGNEDEWERVAKALLREGVDAGSNEDAGLIREGKPRLFSDMFALEAIAKKDEVIVTPYGSVLEAHQEETPVKEIMAWDLDVVADYLNRGTSLVQQHCEEMEKVMALHFSHAATLSLGYLWDDRPILIAAFLDRWSKLCGGPAFHFDDIVDAGVEPEAKGIAEGVPTNSVVDIVSNKATPDALYNTDETMAISRENSFLYVHIPKTGGSSFDQSDLFSDALAHHQIGGHYTIGAMMKNAEERQLTDFIKAAHIRHPCDRFISAFAYLTSDKCNEGDKEWAQKSIKGKSIDEFVLELEKTPDLLAWAHFAPMSNFLFHRDGTFGIDVALCQETWDQSLNKLSKGFDLPVPDKLYSTHSLKNGHSKCEDLLPQTKAAIERIYHMDYCTFGYDSLPQLTCPQLDTSPEEFTRRHQTCNSSEKPKGSEIATAQGQQIAQAR